MLPIVFKHLKYFVFKLKSRHSDAVCQTLVQHSSVPSLDRRVIQLFVFGCIITSLLFNLKEQIFFYLKVLQLWLNSLAHKIS